MEVRRIPPCPDYDIRGTEKWLEDMALKGYILCKGHAFQYGFAYFALDTPRCIRYRLSPAKKVAQSFASPSSRLEPPDEETQELHSRLGWKYITYWGQFWIFGCEDPDAPEMNTDPRIQAIALEVVQKRLWVHFLMLMIYGVLMILSQSPLFCSSLIEQGSRHFWPLPIFVILVCIAWLPGLIHIIRFRRELKQGVFPETTTYLSPAKAQAQFISHFLPLLWLLVSILVAPRDVTRIGDYLTPEVSAELDLVTAADLFPEAEVEYISSSNYIFRWETDCASDCTDLAEDFRLTLPDGTTATGVWNLSRYETDYDWIAAGYARETRLIYWLRGGTSPLDVTSEDADWIKAFHVDNSDRYRYAFDVILIQKDNIFLECSLTLSDDFPDSYTLEALAQFLLEAEA